MAIPAHVAQLLRSPAFAYVATLMPDGSPQVTETWIDTDGTSVIINTVIGYRKYKNLQRDGRVALVVSRPDNPARHVAIRGTVSAMSTEGARDHIETLSQRYFGHPYPMHSRGERVLVYIDPTAIHDNLGDS